jgi:hypothetical protein
VAAGSLREPVRVSQMLMVLVLGCRPPPAQMSKLSDGPGTAGRLRIEVARG